MLDWPKMLRALAEKNGWLPEQVWSIPVATFWLMNKLVSSAPREHNLGSIQERWNRKFRIALGLPPIDFSR